MPSSAAGRSKRAPNDTYKSKKAVVKTTGRARDKTRKSAPRLIDSTENDERALSARLKHLGLYAANTLGDGSCLFRSLSDQLHGTPNHHLTIRSEVCNFLLYHQDEFIAFIDDSNHSSPQAAFAAHVAEMRMSSTYGTQVEIVAFARMVKRRVKVIQAELVYVIGYEDESPASREKRQLRKDTKGKGKDEGEDLPDLYIVYHNWEHYSSARNIQGPHTGLPCIVEQAQPMPGAEPAAKVEDEPRATQEESLILSSLRHPHRHTVIEIRKLIHDSGGSWEKALEGLLQNEVDETESEDFDHPSPISVPAEVETLPSIDVSPATPGLGIKAHHDLRSHAAGQRHSSPSASSSTATSTTTHLSNSTTATQLSDLQDQEKLQSQSASPSVSSRVRSRANSMDPDIQASESPRQRFRLHEPRNMLTDKDDASSTAGGDDLATLDGSSVVSAGSSAGSASVESLDETASASGASQVAAQIPTPEAALLKPRRGRPPKGSKDTLKAPKVPTRRQRKQLIKAGGSPIVNRTRSKAPQAESGLQREFKELYV